MKIRSLMNQRRQLKIGIRQMYNQIFQVYNSFHMIQVTVGYRIKLKQVFIYYRSDFVGSHIHVQPDNITLVCHDRADFQIAQQEYTLHDIFLYRLYLSFFGSLLDDRLDFLFGHLIVGFLDSQ